jgi:hypothetical protein
MIITWAEASDWRRGLEAISLDLTRVVYHRLGVNLRLEETFRGLARDAIAGNYSEGTLVANEVSAAHSNLVFFENQVTPMLEILHRSLGADATANVKYWIRYVFCTQDDNPWRIYEDAVSSWASHLRKTGKDQFGLRADANAIELHLRALVRNDNSECLLVAQAKQPPSPWDHPLFDERGLKEIPIGSEFFPFVDDLLVAIRMNTFQQFWAWLRTQIAVEDLRAISRFVEQKARDLRIDFIEPELLPVQKVMGRAPSPVGADERTIDPLML